MFATKGFVVKGNVMKQTQKTLLLTGLLFAQASSCFAIPTTDMFGSWNALTLQGDFKALSPDLDKVKWLVTNQARTRDDSAKNSRLSENLLFAQVGYQVNPNVSFWLGYAHEWLHPLNKSAYQENRAYQDFVWNETTGDFKWISRTRMEERVNATTGDVGYRPRQLLQVNYSLGFVEGLSAYVGDEVFFYVNKNKFGKKGFTENYIFSGLSYQASEHIGADLGYMGQYIDNIKGNNLFTHNVQFNLRYQF